MENNTNPTPTTNCPVCGRANPVGAVCPNSTHPVAGPAHRALAMDLPQEGEA